MTARRCYLLGMRSAVGFGLVTLMLGGCPTTPGGECMQDRDCEGGDVCGRDGSCTSPASVRQVTLTWTVRGAPASEAACAAHPDLFVSFLGSGPTDTLGFAPVPCFIGQFNVDKLPDRFDAVELGVDGGASSTKAITGATVAFDLR